MRTVSWREQYEEYILVSHHNRQSLLRDRVNVCKRGRGRQERKV